MIHETIWHLEFMPPFFFCSMKLTKKFIQVPHILALNTALNLSFQMVYDMWADGNFFLK